MQQKSKKLAAIRVNEGLIAAYQRDIDKLLDEMDKSITYWLTAGYRANQPEMLAQDASPASMLNKIMARLTKKWTRKFNDKAKPLADYYTQAAKDRTDASLQAALKKAGFTVEFKVTKEVQDIMTATVNENVSLIKTIASEHLSDVNQLVQRSVQSGRDLSGLRSELQQRYGITKRKAALIARQSNNNASAALLRTRYKDLGITTAQWVHSSAGRHPRHEHIDWNGKTYDVNQGMWSAVSKKYVWPGTDFNCRCISRAIVKTVDKVSASAIERAK